jgi:hypothetical protein
MGRKKKYITQEEKMKPKNDGNENTITETKNDSIKSQCEDIIKTKNEFYVYALIDLDTHLPLLYW